MKITIHVTSNTGLQSENSHMAPAKNEPQMYLDIVELKQQQKKETLYSILNWETLSFNIYLWCKTIP